MIHVIIPFEVYLKDIDKVKEIIRTFLRKIKENELDTLVYKSFQQKDQPEKFIHIMTFANEEAQNKHRNSPWCKTFVDQLYPKCKALPQPTSLQEIKI